MDNCNYLNKKIEQVGYLYKYDLLNDFLQDKYRDDDYLYNFYSSCVKKLKVIKSLIVCMNYYGSRQSKIRINAAML